MTGNRVTCNPCDTMQRHQRRLYMLCFLAVCTSSLLTIYVWFGSINRRSLLETQNVIRDKWTRLVTNNEQEYGIREELKNRLLKVQETCTEHEVGKTENILAYKERKMAYCVVPKIGCTFWIRIFRFLNNDTEGIAVRSPFDMDARVVHGNLRRTMKMYRMEKAEDLAEINNMTRFMFTRNPFSRLWSAYVNVLVSAKMWTNLGRTIARHRHNASLRSLRCGDDVTFQEFLQFITDRGLKSPVKLNGHWRPIQYYCNPCIFKPHIVAKMETFSRDSKHILSLFNLSHLLQNFSHNKHMESEIKHIAMTNFRLRHGDITRCHSKQLLAKRAWKALQSNGYLPLDREWPEKKYQHNVSMSTFLREAMEVHRQNPIAVDEWRSARTNIMLDAYSQLPKSLLNKIVFLFKRDFEYFGYETTLNGQLNYS